MAVDFHALVDAQIERRRRDLVHHGQDLSLLHIFHEAEARILRQELPRGGLAVQVHKRVQEGAYAMQLLFAVTKREVEVQGVVNRSGQFPTPLARWHCRASGDECRIERGDDNRENGREDDRHDYHRGIIQVYAGQPTEMHDHLRQALSNEIAGNRPDHAKNQRLGHKEDEDMGGVQADAVIDGDLLLALHHRAEHGVQDDGRRQADRDDDLADTSQAPENRCNQRVLPGLDDRASFIQLHLVSNSSVRQDAYSIDKVVRGLPGGRRVVRL